MKTLMKNFPGFQPLNLTMLKISFPTSILHTLTNLDLYLVYSFLPFLFLTLHFFKFRNRKPKTRTLFDSSLLSFLRPPSPSLSPPLLPPTHSRPPSNYHCPTTLLYLHPFLPPSSLLRSPSLLLKSPSLLPLSLRLPLLLFSPPLGPPLSRLSKHCPSRLSSLLLSSASPP